MTEEYKIPLGKEYFVSSRVDWGEKNIILTVREGLPGDLIKIGTLLKSEDLFRTDIQNQLKDGVYEIYAKKTEVNE